MKELNPCVQSIGKDDTWPRQQGDGQRRLGCHWMIQECSLKILGDGF